MSRGPNLERRADLEAALKRAKPADLILLTDLAKLWGTSKQNFVNTMREIEKLFDVPATLPGPHGAHLYPAKKTIAVMLAYEKRNDDMHSRLQVRTAAILGRGKGRKKADEAYLPIGELAQLSRVMTETEVRERDQGLYCSLGDQAATAGRVFSKISGYLSELEANIDPNGILPPEIRAVLREGGRTLALEIHGEMKDMLSGDAKPKSRGATRRRGADGGARRPRARRARG